LKKKAWAQFAAARMGLRNGKAGVKEVRLSAGQPILRIVMSKHESLPFFRYPASAALAVAFVLALFFTENAHATVRFWTGGGANNNWNNGANWSTGVAPVANDDLIFQGGAVVDATSLINTNNYAAGTVFNSITITGTNYTLYGNLVLFTNSGIAISAQNIGGVNTVEFPIQLGVTAQTLECTASGAFLNLGGFFGFPTLNLNGQNLIVSATGSVQFFHDITGTGNLTKNGSGRWLLAAAIANTYVGTCSVNAGTLELNDVAGLSEVMVTGNLNINNSSIVEETEGNQIADTAAITMNDAGQFNLVGVNDTIGSLTILAGGDVATGGGTLTVEGNISAAAAFLNVVGISGNLSLGSANRVISVSDALAATPGVIMSANLSGGAGVGFTKLGTGSLRLSGANTYSGATTVSAGFLNLANNSALGNGGQGTTLSGGHLLMEGVNISNEWLTNSSASSTVQGLGGVTSTWGSNIVLNANLNVTVFTTGILDFVGGISGTGGFTKNEIGTLRLSGPFNSSSFGGNTTLNAGTLELNSQNCIRFGTLTIGDGWGGPSADVVRFLINYPIHSDVDVVIKSSGRLDLNGFVDDIATVTMDGGNIVMAAGRLDLLSPAVVNTISTAVTNGDCTISGALNLLAGSATFGTTNNLTVNANVTGGSTSGLLSKIGGSALTFSASNSYAPTTVVQEGSLFPQGPWSLGGTTSGTIVSNGGTLGLTTTAITNESLTLNGVGIPAFGNLDVTGSTNVWAGPVTLNGGSTILTFGGSAVLRIVGVISGPGSLTKQSSGILYLNGPSANTYSGVTTVTAGTLLLDKPSGVTAIPGNLTVGDGSGTDVVRLLNNNQIANTSDVTVTSSGLFDLDTFFDTIDELSGSGNVTFGVLGYIDVGANNGSSTFSGIASGTGFTGGYTIRKSGSGTFTLTGNNTYLNHTRVSAGTLIINGSQPQSPLSVLGGTAGGTGTVGDISCSADLQPGNSPGCLTSSNLFFAASGDFYVELTGTTPCSGHDQLVVNGTNNLNNATLHVVNNFPPGKPSIGDQFIIINNDAAEAITGTFTGLVNNATFSVDDIGYRINYNGGSGNDVVLTVLNAPGASVTINNSDRGWYNFTGDHTPGSVNYYVGQQFTGGYHNWFVFNVPQFAGTIVHAELLINTYSNVSPNALETYVLRHVSTAIGTLVAGGSGLTAIYDDLADGSVYSVRDLLKVEAGQRAIIPLNLTFINDATAAAGGQIALGGSLCTLNTNIAEQAWFAFSHVGAAPSDVQLRLTFGTSTTLNAIARGWYDGSGNHSAGNANYFVGESGGSALRNFFVFDLPMLTSPLFTAELFVKPYQMSTPTNFVDYRLHDVSTAITTLTNAASGATGTFVDLGTGGDYGGRYVFTNEPPTKISISLNNQFVGAASASSGNRIALGGSLVLDPTPNNEALFSFSPGIAVPDDVQLWLGFVPLDLPSAYFAPGSPASLENNRYQFVLTGTAGTTNEIQTSTDLLNWDVARTLYMTNVNTTFNYTNVISPRFFRARLVQ
jgi:autotransporter-associated beta strand protein